MPSRPRPNPLLWLSIVVGALLTMLAVPVDASAGGSAGLTLVGPDVVTANQPFTVAVVARGVHDLGGYQATVRFDAKAVMFGGAEQRSLGLAATGRGVESLGPVMRPDGVVIGAFSCDTADCVSRTGRRAASGPDGSVVVARLAFTARNSGSLQLALGRILLVDTAGRAISGIAADASVRVTSRRPNGRTASRSIALPAPRDDGSDQRSPTGKTVRDLNRDGIVSHADAMDAAIGWVRVRDASAVCGQAARHDDATGDGCLDIRDVQRIAAGSVGARGLKGNATKHDVANPSIVVDSTGDADDATPGDGHCATSSGDCTLRAAISETNADVGSDEIDFAIPGGGVHTITLGSALPTISDQSGPTTIDGYTQSGASPNTDPLVDNAVLQVEITGTADMDGIAISSAGNTLRGLAWFGLHRAIWLIGPGSQDNVLEGNWIGENAAATWNAPDFVNMANGVSLTNGAFDNRVGTATAAGRNVISGNAHNAIWFWDEGTDGNTIVNNLLGPAPSGTANLRNVGRGVDINAMASFNVVGGDGSMERNVISGNAAEGIEFSHNRMTNDNRAVDNFIGTDATGEAAPAWAANGWSGLHFEDGATENMALGNVVANSGCENFAGNVAMETTATGNVLRDNFIGVSRSGAALGTCAGTVPDNDPLWGVILRTGAFDNQIGPGNEIAHNPGGVWIEDDATDGNTITQNSIHDNGGSGIELRSTGANGGILPPTIASATIGTITGTTCAGCRVELFRSGDAASALGAGKRFLGAVTADVSGAFSVGIDGLVVNQVVTATATDHAGDTSQFAHNVSVAAQTNRSSLASDAFSRSVSGGFGTADVGGTYRMSGPAADAAVSGGHATWSFATGGEAHGAVLEQASAANLMARIRLRLSAPVQGAAASVTLLARRSQGAEYRATLTFQPNGKTFLRLYAAVPGAALVPLGPRVNLGSIAPATWMTLIISTTGSAPTVLRAKAWSAGTPEPGWQLTVSDATESLQGAGSVGLRASIGSAATGLPLRISFDGLSATAPVKGPPPPPPPPPPKAVALDAFSRNVSSAWGRAVAGGTWAVANNYPDYNVDGARGTMELSAVGDSRGAFLESVSIQDLDMRMRFGTDVMPTGDGTFFYGIVRRVRGNSAYRFKVRLAPTGGVWLEATRVLQGVESDLTLNETRVAGLAFSPGSDLVLRAQAVGTNPTTLRMKVWAAGTAEPSAWQYETTDGSASLQAAGAVGVRGYLPGNATSTVLVHVDNFRVAAP